jgi:hypothetical protein
VSVDVYGSRQHQAAVGIEARNIAGRSHLPDRDDPTVLDQHVRTGPRAAGHDRPALYQQVVRH